MLLVWFFRCGEFDSGQHAQEGKEDCGSHFLMTMSRLVRYESSIIIILISVATALWSEKWLMCMFWEPTPRSKEVDEATKIEQRLMGLEHWACIEIGKQSRRCYPADREVSYQNRPLECAWATWEVRTRYRSARGGGKALLERSDKFRRCLATLVFQSKKLIVRTLWAINQGHKE